MIHPRDLAEEAARISTIFTHVVSREGNKFYLVGEYSDGSPGHKTFIFPLERRQLFTLILTATQVLASEK
jgi:hypothetical protein